MRRAAKRPKPATIRSDSTDLWQVQFGPHIRALRAARGLSQAELGAPDYTRAHVSAIELGKILPSIKALAHFGDRLRLPVRDLFPTGDAVRDAPSYDGFTPALAEEPTGPGSHSEIEPRALDVKVSGITAVTLQRSGCFGTCPIYKVTLRVDGRATWHGEMFTDRIGDYRGEVDPGDFEELAEFVGRCGFFNWNAQYAIDITDSPTYQLVVRRGRKTKSVSQYATAEPPDFWVIAALVDAIAEKVHWTAVLESGNPPA